ncbi:MAG: hypothetical protein K8F36_12085, partial [Melioribacteraceae bacterium]|nr:hypothetical protein [Melioribacteraceae bacterium]
MKKALWLLFLLTFAVSSAFGQDTKFRVQNNAEVKADLKAKLAEWKALENANAVLFDQISDPGGFGSASQQFPDFADCVIQTADDFLVPGSEVWTITEIQTLGSWSAMGPTSTVDVYIWEDDGGVPGTLVYSQLGYVPGDPSDANFVVPLTVPAELSGGQYLLSVMSVMNFGGGDPGQWFWGTQNSGYGDIRILRDPCDLLGAGYIDWGIHGGTNNMSFALIGTSELVGPGYATNPFPANNAIDIPAAGTTLTWDNPGAKAADYNAVYFGSDLALVEARDESVKVLGDEATLFDEYETGALDYNTTYYWAVDETELAKSPGTTFGNVWKFTTEAQYPEFTWIDDFEAGTDNWDIYGVDGSFCVWEADESPWDNGYLMPPTASGTILRADSDLCGSGTTMNTYLEMNKGVDLSDFAGTMLIWDGDQRVLGGTLFEVDLSIDGGLSWMNIFSENASRRTETVAIPVPEADFQADVRFRFHYEAHGWHWWWAIDNVTIHAITPLTSMYGYLMHPNENPISGATLRMESEEKYIFETTTNEDGWFEFMEVPPGTFWMDIVSDYPAYTLDTRDAFLVSKQANKTEPYPTGDMFFVSDVTADGEVRWNDAVMIFERIFGDIDGFNQPDWLGTFGDEAFVHGGEDMDMGILYAWLAGDADLSYGNTLRSLKMLEVTKSGSRSLAIGSEVSVPYYVTSDAEVSAAMMRFNYSDKYEFVGLDSKLANATVINGEGFVGIMYIDKPVNF